MSNAYWEPLDFDLPVVPGAGVGGWRRWIDTALESPEDIVDPAAVPSVPGTQYRVMPRSLAALLLRIDARSGPAFEVAAERPAPKSGD
jgi:isoamylase